MSIYESLFNKILESKKEFSLVLSALPEDIENSSRKSSGEFIFPIDLTNLDGNVKELPGGEEYIAAMIDFIKTERPKSVLLLPPWKDGINLDPELRKTYTGHSLEMMALLKALEVAEKNTQIVTMLRKVHLSSFSEAKSRKKITSLASIDCVIELDDSETPSHVIDQTIIAMHKMKAEEQNTVFLRFDISADTTIFFREWSKLRSGKETEQKSGYYYSGQLNSESSLAYDRYHPSYDRLQQEVMTHFGEVTRLDKIYDYVPHVRPRDVRRRGEHYVEFGIEETLNDNVVPILSGKDISRQQDIEQQNISRGWDDPDEKYLLQEDDVCLASVGSLPVERIVKLKSEDLPLVASSSVLVLRPKSNTTLEQQQLLLNYLQSSYAFKLLKREMSSSGKFYRLVWKSMGDLLVPVPTDSMLDALNELQQAEKSYSEWIKEAKKARSNLFEIPNSRVARLDVKAETRRVRQRYRVASSIDDFKTRVRTRFPHPIAYRWKLVETRYKDYQGYKYILECAEATIAYMGSIGILLSMENDEIETIGTIKGGGKGKTFGHWKDCLTATAKRFAGADENQPFLDLIRFAGLNSNNETIRYFAEALDYLYNARNDDAHGEGPKGFQVKKSYGEAYEHLEQLLNSVEFLSEYRLRYIERTRRDTYENVTYYDHRELMGDHNLVPIVEGSYVEDCELEAGSLYLLDRDNGFHLMRPILLWHPAAGRNRYATFYLNKHYTENEHDVCEIRSLELGDTIELENMTDLFQSAKLLELN